MFGRERVSEKEIYEYMYLNMWSKMINKGINHFMLSILLIFFTGPMQGLYYFFKNTLGGLSDPRVG